MFKLPHAHTQIVQATFSRNTTAFSHPSFRPATHSPKMSKKAAVPDAWDDDWESQADKVDAEAEKANAEQQVKISKAELLARHAETNKKIWESA